MFISLSSEPLPWRNYRSNPFSQTQSGSMWYRTIFMVIPSAVEGPPNTGLVLMSCRIAKPDGGFSTRFTRSK